MTAVKLIDTVYGTHRHDPGMPTARSTGHHETPKVSDKPPPGQPDVTMEMEASNGDHDRSAKRHRKKR